MSDPETIKQAKGWHGTALALALEDGWSMLRHDKAPGRFYIACYPDGPRGGRFKYDEDAEVYVRGLAAGGHWLTSTAQAALAYVEVGHELEPRLGEGVLG